MPEALLWLLLTGEVPTKAQVSLHFLLYVWHKPYIPSGAVYTSPLELLNSVELAGGGEEGGLCSYRGGGGG